MNSLDLVVIARNEARCITRCLNSFAGHVDRMWVLDTGSSDDTPALARAAGAEVHHFDWCDDFSAARNAVLQRASADWHLVVDADEWLESGAQALTAWRQRRPECCGVVTVRSAVENSDGHGVVSASLLRLLPGTVRYQGRIHEQPATGLPALATGLTLLHDGYAPAQVEAKQHRNERLLRMALAERPGDAYLLFQLGVAVALRGGHAEAAGAYAQALQRVVPQASYRGELVRRMLITLQTLREWTVAAQLLEAEMPNFDGSAYFMLTAGNVFWNWAQDQPQAAAAVLPMAEQSWQRALDLSTQRSQTSGPPQGPHLEQTSERAALSLAALYRQRVAALATA